MKFGIRCMLCMLILTGVVWAQDKPTNGTPAPKNVPVTKGAFEYRGSASGKLVSAEVLEFRVVPEAYDGPLAVEESAAEGQYVDEGVTIVRFDLRWIDEKITDAEAHFAKTQLALKSAQDDFKMFKDSMQLDLMRLERADREAQENLKRWQEWGGPRFKKAAELTLQRRRDNLADEKEELAQLEKMYEGTELDSETRDIVLERARRSVKVAEEWLRIVETDDQWDTETEHARKQLNFQTDAKKAAMDLAHGRTNWANKEAATVLGVDGAERAAERSQVLLDRLRRDRDALHVTAPRNGIVTSVSADPESTVRSRAVIAKLADATALEIEASLPAAWRTKVEVGAKLEAQFAAWPDLRLPVTVRELSHVGTGKEGTFTALLSIAGKDARLALGVPCKVIFTHTIADALTVPSSTVSNKDGVQAVTVWADGKKALRTVRIGTTSSGRTVILEGLSEGDRVVVPEKKK